MPARCALCLVWSDTFPPPGVSSCAELAGTQGGGCRTPLSGGVCWLGAAYNQLPHWEGRCALRWAGWLREVQAQAGPPCVLQAAMAEQWQALSSWVDKLLQRSKERTELLDAQPRMHWCAKVLKNEAAATARRPAAGTLRSNLDPWGTQEDARLWEALHAVQLGPAVSALGGLVSASIRLCARPSRRIWAVQRMLPAPFIHLSIPQTSPFPPAAQDARMAEAGSNISVGQRQLFALARALLQVRGRVGAASLGGRQLYVHRGL